MAATTDSNLLYVRHDENNQVDPTQPTSTPGTADPGSGWETQVYLNFDGDYVPYDEDGNQLPPPADYVKRGELGQIIPAGKYIRVDEAGDAVDPQPPLATAAAGVIFAPEGLAVGRDIAAQAASFTGGTPPFTYEAQLQRETSPGVWEGFTPWLFVSSGVRVLSSNEVGMRIRANTRVTDKFNTTPIIVPGTPTSTQVQPAMVSGTKGTLTSSGGIPARPGDVLTQTEGAVSGGIAPLTKAYEWIRRPISGGTFVRFGAPNGLTYTVQPEDVGFEIRGRTRWKDAFGYYKSNATTPGQIEIVE